MKACYKIAYKLLAKLERGIRFSLISVFSDSNSNKKVVFPIKLGKAGKNNPPAELIHAAKPLIQRPYILIDNVTYQNLSLPSKSASNLTETRYKGFGTWLKSSGMTQERE